MRAYFSLIMGKKSKRGFERKTINGQPNPRYVDLMTEDRPIAGQEFVLMSFVSPENIIKQKEMFFFEQFLKKWDFTKSMEKFSEFLNFLSVKYNVSFEGITQDFTEFVETEKDALTRINVLDDYQTFLEHHEDTLQKIYDEKVEFQTNVRGVKVRGSFATEAEARLRAKALRDADDAHDVYVGKVGVWMPWEPNAYKTGDIEYMDDELNQLMHEKRKNSEKAKQEFDQRKKESAQRAIEENIRKAEKSGNVLSQTVDEHGNLVGANNVNTQERMLAEREDSDDDTHQYKDRREEVANVLFEGDNIVVGKTDYGQSLLKSGPFAPSNRPTAEDTNP